MFQRISAVLQEGYEQDTHLGELRWRSCQLIFVLGSLGMVPLILTGRDYAWSTMGPLLILSIGFSILAIAQGLVKRVSFVIEILGLGLGLSVYLARFIKVLREVVSQDLPPEALADVFAWAAVTYVVIFIALPQRLALVFSLSLWLGVVSFGFIVFSSQAVVRWLEPMFDLSLSGLVTILVLLVFRSMIEVGAKASARAEAMALLATKDSLTGLSNRRYLDEVLTQEFARAVRYEHPLSVAVCDVDFFKTINDRFSHDVGDKTLQKIAQIIFQSVREVDIVARYGGEEFVIVFVETEIEAAHKVCEHLRKTIEAYSWSSIHPELSVTVSIGLSNDVSLINHEKLLHEADIKLYEAKHKGKNRVCL